MLIPLFKPWFKQEPYCLKLQQADFLLKKAEETITQKEDFADINTSRESEQFYWNYSMLKMRAKIKRFWIDYSGDGSVNDKYIRNLIRMMPETLSDNDSQVFSLYTSDRLL